MDFIQNLPIDEKYKNILFENFKDDLSSYTELGILTIKKFIKWYGNNDFDEFKNDLQEYTISFIGYTEYILDDKITIGVGYGTAYILIKEFYDTFKNKIEKVSEIMVEKKPDMCSKNDLSTIKVNISGKIKTQCIKVASLRKEFGDESITLKKWMEIPNNLYVGRRGRIFIDGKIFHYKESKWYNPYTLKEYSLEDSLKLYKKYIKTSGLYDDLDELKGKTLGCFCDQSGDCHAKVLVKLYRKKKEKEFEK